MLTVAAALNFSTQGTVQADESGAGTSKSVLTEQTSGRRTSVGPDRIADLVWPDAPVLVRVERTPDTEVQRVLVLVSGTYARADWKLYANRRPVTVNGNVFRFWLPLTGRKSALEMVAVGPSREVQRERVVLEVFGLIFGKSSKLPPGWARDPEAGGAQQGPQFSYSVSPGIGLTFLAYHETDLPDVNQIALTGKVSAVYFLSPSWDLGASGYLTLTSLQAGRADPARFLGLNARLGYTLPFIGQPWKISLLAGGYYTTMFVPTNAYGFKNMMGPQVFPTIRYRFADGGSAWLYGKFSPVTDGASLNFTNRELAFGGGYAFRPRGWGSPSLTLDIADFFLNFGEFEIRSTSYSVGAGASF